MSEDNIQELINVLKEIRSELDDIAEFLLKSNDWFENISTDLHTAMRYENETNGGIRVYSGR